MRRCWSGPRERRGDVYFPGGGPRLRGRRPATPRPRPAGRPCSTLQSGAAAPLRARAPALLPCVPPRRVLGPRPPKRRCPPLKPVPGRRRRRMPSSRPECQVTRASPEAWRDATAEQPGADAAEDPVPAPEAPMTPPLASAPVFCSPKTSRCPTLGSSSRQSLSL